MKRIFHPYDKWEDYINGMYSKHHEDADILIDLSKNMLSDQTKFYKYGKKMISEWVFSSDQNLSNKSINRMAWVGQATCCFAHEAPDFVTKKAWDSMEQKDRDAANKTAIKLINEWENRNEVILCKV